MLWGVILPLAVAIGMTGWILSANLDLRLQEWLFDFGGGSWDLGREPFWKGLYHWGTYPAAVIAVGAVIAYCLSWVKRGLSSWRRVFLFLFWSLVIGPGLVVNAGLKDNWGRPRPRDIDVFGGGNRFEPVFSIDESSDGKSFPCGHATMGFYFFGAYFLLRGNRKKLAAAFLVFALVYGALLGIARMAQGGHFFSDVIWSGLICYFTAMGLYFAFGLNRSLVWEGRSLKKPSPIAIKAAAGAVVAALVTAVLLATPYSDKQILHIGVIPSIEENLHLDLRFALGDVTIKPSDHFEITSEGN